jgi:hypothetical protein
VLCLLPLAGRCPATSKHVGGMQGDFSKLASWNLGFHDSCNWSKEKRRQNIHTPNSHVPAPRLPPAVGSGLLSSFRACLLACLLACWPSCCPRIASFLACLLASRLLACSVVFCSACIWFQNGIYIYVYIYIRLHPWRLKSQVGRHDDEEAAYFWGVRKGGGHECLACMWSMIWCPNFFK